VFESKSLPYFEPPSPLHPAELTQTSGNRFFKRFIVNEIMILGRRSLHLVQAALVLAIWNYPPREFFQEVNFSQMAGMAATVVADLRSSVQIEYTVDTIPRNCKTLLR
jgi:hypothetical protein